MLRHPKHLLGGVGLPLALNACTSSPDPEAFKTPPAEFRPHTLWFWNDTSHNPRRHRRTNSPAPFSVAESK